MSKKYKCLMYICLFSFTAAVVPVKAVTPDKEAAAPYINARCAIAMDAKSKIVLLEKDSNQIVPMASTTKIITSLVALKYGNLDKKVTISHKSASIHGSTVGYKEGEEISIRELVYGLMLRSGNDAAIALAEGIAGSVEEFCKLMNEFSHQLGLTNTHFESPHGLDSENHYTTAYDLALITAAAKDIREFNDIVSSKDVDGSTLNFTRSFHNINKLLWLIPEANGVKTGYTGQAGKCLVSSVQINNHDVIIVVLNSPGRWKETSKIYDYIKDKYEYKTIAAKGEIVWTSESPSIKTSVILRTSEVIDVPVRKSSTVYRKVLVPVKITNKMLHGDNLGRLQVYEDEKVIYSTSLTCDNTPSNMKNRRKFFNFVPSLR